MPLVGPMAFLATSIVMFSSLLGLFPESVVAQLVAPSQVPTMQAIAGAMFPSGVFSSWNSANPCSSWNGVTCNSNGFVTQINLGSSFLSGTISPVIGNLGSLQQLSLFGNNLAGSIPTEIGSLSSLVTLALNGNSFSGTIPASLGGLTQLHSLLLHDNFLTGPIPASIGSATALQTLNVHNNSLTGVIPDTLWKLSSLAYLRLSLNGLTGGVSSAVGGLPKLEFFSVSNNFLNGTIPSAVVKLGVLNFLDVANNSLTGYIPASLSTLPNLQSVDLSRNLLIGGFSSSSGVLLDFSAHHNYLTGPIVLTDASGTACPAALSVNLNLNCLSAASAAASCGGSGRSRPASQCAAFCNALQPNGACGSRGTCAFAISNSSTGIASTVSECKCFSGYNDDAIELTCQFVLPSTGLVAPPSLSTPLSNGLFRYASSGYLNSSQGVPAWEVATSWNWVLEAAVRKPQNQQGCAACWAFATASAMEAASYIISAAASPLAYLSIQQIVDCAGGSTGGKCTGGFPADAFTFATKTKIVDASFHNYKAKNESCKTFKKTVGGLTILSYETVSFFGWYGLLLAVQQQPVVVSIEASQPSFVQYLTGVFADPACFLNGVDHTVLLVGYDLTASVPYWLLKNSWGGTWGESGYMRMAITGGEGICGINTVPGIYPVLAGHDACNTVNYGRKVQGNAFPFAPGTLNPCGGGNCVLPTSGTQNKCTACPPNFVPATNSDGSQTCAPKDPCSFFTYNPCNAGTCMASSSSPGTYFCLCPLGYAVGTRSLDGSPTCISSTFSTGLQTYIVPSGPIITCAVVAQVYFIDLTLFIKQQAKGVNCKAPLPVGTLLNVTTAQTCQLPYVTNPGDTCTSILRVFGITPPKTVTDTSVLFGAGSPNPNVDCSSLSGFAVGTRLCIIRGPPLPVPVCTAYYIVQAGDTCSSIIGRQLANNYTRFYSLNPGINCARLSAQLTSTRGTGAGTATLDTPYEVCLAASDFGTINENCGANHRLYSWKGGDTCLAILRRFYSSSQVVFKRLNQGARCLDDRLQIGATICRP
eukprot:TRINITY_DN2197_c0_g2_i2.p1 TRINITY_DN2197_c0_g2~~TRINITY_DN2197_c0_g2_i2.p1  ORF type:complete len:1042 (-),score=112.83 TRINITY_DN2197_c0_g2_i2:379-3504(-)